LEETIHQENQQKMEELIKEMGTLLKREKQMGKIESSQLAKAGYYTVQ
jgi:hypothetical protein